MADQDEKHPLLTAYDQAIHAVTEQFRRDHPDFWFSVEKCHFKKANGAQVMAASSARVHPLLADYRTALDKVTEQFNQQNTAFQFWYTGSRIKPISEGVKADSIQHKTEIVKPA